MAGEGRVSRNNDGHQTIISLNSKASRGSVKLKKIFVLTARDPQDDSTFQGSSMRRKVMRLTIRVKNFLAFKHVLYHFGDHRSLSEVAN